VAAALETCLEHEALAPVRDYIRGDGGARGEARRLELSRGAEAAAELLPPDETSRRLTASLSEMTAALDRLTRLGEEPETVYDDRIWAALITVLTAIVLVLGRYKLIETFATVLVVLFTIITIGNLFHLQTSDVLRISGKEFTEGMAFRLPKATPSGDAGRSALETALKTFGIIGVGASELVAYPYWCLEKGYARFTGPRDDSPEWAARARGWMRVLHWDAWMSMGIYTFATVAFYLVGAATLGRFGLEASGTGMVRTLAVMYEPIFGDLAPLIFLFGAIAVLYSTFFVSNASHARVVSDALRVLFHVKMDTPAEKRKWVRIFSGIFPFLCLTVYLFIQEPKALVLLSGLMQALMLPMLAGAALFFRYRRGDARLRPGRVWDVMLWVSAFAMLATGGALAWLLFT